MSTTPPAASGAGEPKPLEKKSLWDKILTSTPVVMTVIATVLAGMSSGQMTQAQYHRSIAAQNQSKAGNQWAFFQAKRIRGTTMLMEIQQLRSAADAGQISEDDVRAIFDRVVEDLDKAEKEAARLGETLKDPESDLGDGEKAVQPKIESLRKKLAKGKTDAEKLRGEIKGVLDKDPKKVEQHFVYLTTRQIPLAEDEVKDGKPVRVDKLVEADVAKINPQILKAANGVQERLGVKEMKALMTPKKAYFGFFRLPSDEQVRSSQLTVAIDKVQERGRMFEKLTDPVIDTGRAVSGPLTRLLGVARAADRNVEDFVTSLPLGDGKTLTQLRQGARALSEVSENTRKRALAAYNSFTAAQLDFDVRRYDREARYTESTARLYELQVRKSEFNSEASQTRSQFIFFGMLAAQAGVTIATVSLAVKQRSVLWTLASVAGLTAIFIGAYVFLFVD